MVEQRPHLSPLLVSPRYTFLVAVSTSCASAAIAGLVVGLYSYPPTAAFAVVEVVLLTSPVTWAIAGCAAGVHALLRHRARRQPRTPAQPH